MATPFFFAAPGRNDHFEMVSGLKINFNKSYLFGLNISEDLLSTGSSNLPFFFVPGFTDWSKSQEVFYLATGG